MPERIAEHVLSLVATDRTAPELVGAAVAALRSVDAVVADLDWLAGSVACDLHVSSVVPEVAEDAVREALRGLPVDFAVQPAAGRRKKLLVADMESTVIRNEMLDELADFVGLRERVEAITRRAMNGELDFRAALDERVALLKDLPLSTLEESMESIRFDPGARTLVATCRAHGVHTALVSGGFTFFADRVAERVGFHGARANVLEIDDDRLTGRVLEPIVDRDAKVRVLDELCDRLGIAHEQAVTVGDGANDLPMLRAAGLGVAFHGKPAVAASARFRIDHGDLSTLLYFQGYRSDEIVSG